MLAEHALGPREVRLVQELIFGDVHEAPPGWQWVGHPERPFLFEIVANKRNGIDVDKWGAWWRRPHDSSAPGPAPRAGSHHHRPPAHSPRTHSGALTDHTRSHTPALARRRC